MSHSFRGRGAGAGDDGQAAQPEPDAVPADQRRDALGAGSGRGARPRTTARRVAGSRSPCTAAVKTVVSPWVSEIADGDVGAGDPGADVVAAVDGEERRDVELLVDGRGAARRRGRAGSSAARRRCCAPRRPRPRGGRRRRGRSTSSAGRTRSRASGRSPASAPGWRSRAGPARRGSRGPSAPAAACRPARSGPRAGSTRTRAATAGRPTRQCVDVDQPHGGAVLERVGERPGAAVARRGPARTGRTAAGALTRSLPNASAARDAGAAAVLVEAPAVVGAGEREPVGVQAGQPVLRGHGRGRVGRVQVGHGGDDAGGRHRARRGFSVTTSGSDSGCPCSRFIQ